MILCWVDDYLLAKISMVDSDGAIKQKIEMEAITGGWLVSLGDKSE